MFEEIEKVKFPISILMFGPPFERKIAENLYQMLSLVEDIGYLRVINTGIERDFISYKVYLYFQFPFRHPVLAKIKSPKDDRIPEQSLEFSKFLRDLMGCSRRVKSRARQDLDFKLNYG